MTAAPQEPPASPAAPQDVPAQPAAPQEPASPAAPQDPASPGAPQNPASPAAPQNPASPAAPQATLSSPTPRQASTPPLAGSATPAPAVPAAPAAAQGLPHQPPGPPAAPGTPPGAWNATPHQGPWAAPLPYRWIDPAAPAGPAAVIALLAAAAIGAGTLTVDLPGLGWLITALAAGAAIAVAGRARTHTEMPPPRVTSAVPTVVRPADRYLWAAVTLLLAGAGTIRAAGWLFALCVLTALATALLAAVGDRSVRALGYLTAVLPAAAGRAVPWLVRGARTIRRRRGGDAPRLALPILLTVVLLIVFGALFASADAAFNSLIVAALPELDGTIVARVVILFPVLLLAIGALAFLRAAPPRTADLNEPVRRPFRRAEWLLPLVALDLLFGAFVLVQAAVLFGGARHVLETDGLTYAEYARSGFWQLLVVTGLTLVVISIAAVTAPRASRADRVLVRVLLGVLSGLTLLIVASALSRMAVYADVYGLTRLRVLVFATEIWLGVIFVMVLVAGIRLHARWLPRAVLGATAVTMLALVAVNPDALIARHNLRRDRIDTFYLRTLSADAAPELARAGDDCLTAQIARDLARHEDDWQDFNLARARARALLGDKAITCTYS
ncbi:DUF4153 domain-containing protein [Catenuloplanes sp. NPDC051500]|uniref:DUF4153 domain-containing protein n=1 Tax=Catenuloplanes sp. NPDC051500 TaxID=3363959 RepID=UPI0037922151